MTIKDQQLKEFMSQTVEDLTPYVKDQPSLGEMLQKIEDMTSGEFKELMEDAKEAKVFQEPTKDK